MVNLVLHQCGILSILSCRIRYIRIKPIFNFNASIKDMMTQKRELTEWTYVYAYIFLNKYDFMSKRSDINFEINEWNFISPPRKINSIQLFYIKNGPSKLSTSFCIDCYPFFAAKRRYNYNIFIYDTITRLYITRTIFQVQKLFHHPRFISRTRVSQSTFKTVLKDTNVIESPWKVGRRFGGGETRRQFSAIYFFCSPAPDIKKAISYFLLVHD